MTLRYHLEILNDNVSQQRIDMTIKELVYHDGLSDNRECYGSNRVELFVVYEHTVSKIQW